MNNGKDFRKLFFFLFLFFAAALSQAQTVGKTITAAADVVNVEITVSGIDVVIAASEEAVISYKYELTAGSELSVVTRDNALRFINFRPSSGTLFIYIPKDFLLNSCRIQALNSNIRVHGIKSIYFAVSGTSNNSEITASMFKNVLIVASFGSITFNSRIIAVADFCFSSAKGAISIGENKEDCNIFITQSKNKKFIFDGMAYEKNTLTSTPQKPKKFITVSASFSELEIGFVEPSIEPVEKFDAYGISEFGPKPPPRLENELSNFLPKN